MFTGSRLTRPLAARVVWTLIAIVSGALFGVKAVQAAVAYVSITASPPAIPANGHTTSTITALVYDTSGFPIPGELVEFRSTLGELTPNAAVTGVDGQVSVQFKVYPLSDPASVEGSAAVVFANTSGVEGSIRVGLFNSPHGAYSRITNACSICHGTHSSYSPRGLKSATDAPVGATPVVASLCFSCHDGTGAISNIKGQYAFLSGNTSFHPVMGTGNPMVNPFLNCTACHNVHGDKKADGTGVYPRLLRQFDLLTGEKVFGGAAFCLACHGPVDRGWGGDPSKPGYYDYYSFTGGDHTALDSVHEIVYAIDPLTGRSIMEPPSGTGIPCLGCHDQHAAKGRWLMNNAEEEACFRCHNSGVLPGSDTLSQFNGANIVSRHDIYGETGAQLECTSCHGPHNVTKTNKVSDPWNTKSLYPYGPGEYSGFCLRCHSANPPREIADSTTVVPYSILWPIWSVTTNLTGYDKDSVWGDSTKATLSSGCALCHAPSSHGSENPNLLNFREDNPVCADCHRSIYSDVDPAALGVSKGDYAYYHPVQDINGAHSNTEGYSDVPSAGRHAECWDCHDVHAANSARVGRSLPGKPGLLAILRNVSGVGVINRGPGTVPDYVYKSSADYEYEVCYKCHSAFSYGASGGPLLSYGQQDDPSVEFNTNNASYHPVEGMGRNPGIAPGSFVVGWDASSVVYCSDCHGSGAGRRGPHGSRNRHILEYPYTAGPGLVDPDEICFKCHQSSVYRDGADEAAPLSRFFGAVTSSDQGTPDVTRWSLHGRHVSMYGASCWNCHAEHGSAGYPRLLVVDPARGITGFDPSLPGCSASCHTKPDIYPWVPAY